MALSPCFNFQERLVPHLRATTARRLRDEGLRQSRIAAHLGVSQAMVSKYLRATPRPPAGADASALDALVGRAVDAVLDAERAGRLPAWCPLCPSLLGPAGADDPLHECLRGERPPAEAETAAVLHDLEAAAARIRDARLARLAPEVQANLAMCLAEAHDARGVAAFPGRLVAVRDRLTAVAPAEFGASQHLSDVLLRVRRAHPSVRAIACLRDDPTTRRAARSAGLGLRVLRRHKGELVVQVAGPTPPDALVDPGDFGIEPITYVLGATAQDVTEKTLRLAKALAGNKAS